MPLLKNLVGVGMAGVVAQNVAGTVTSSLTATGSTSQANSLLITDAINNVTAGAAATGVRLPSGEAGDSMVIGNSKTDTLFVYPPVGGKINGGTTDAKIDVLTVNAAICVCINGLDWICIYNT
jgi:hypothetical protein